MPPPGWPVTVCGPALRRRRARERQRPEAVGVAVAAAVGDQARRAGDAGGLLDGMQIGAEFPVARGDADLTVLEAFLEDGGHVEFDGRGEQHALDRHLAVAAFGARLRTITSATTAFKDAGAIIEEIGGLISTAERAAPPYGGVLSISGLAGALDAVRVTTPSRRRQAANRSAMSRLLDGYAVTAAARSIAARAFPTSVDAFQARDAITAAVDDLLPAAPAVEYRRLTELSASVVRHVSRIAPAAPRVVRVTSGAARPALVIANEIFGDDPRSLAGHAAAIASRNRLRHPGFTPSDPLEVLVDG